MNERIMFHHKQILYTLTEETKKNFLMKSTLIRYPPQKKEISKGNISTVEFDIYILHSSVIIEPVQAIERTYHIRKGCRIHTNYKALDEMKG